MDELEQAAQDYCLQASGFQFHVSPGKISFYTTIFKMEYWSYRLTWSEVASAIAIILDMREAPVMLLDDVFERSLN